MNSYILLAIAICLLYLLLPIVCVYMVIRTVVSRKPKKFLKLWARKTARSTDVLFNVIGADVMNDLFIRSGGYKFGNQKETISSVIGKNDRINKLTKGGKVLRFILDRIEKDHCKLSIKEDLTNTSK